MVLTLRSCCIAPRCLMIHGMGAVTPSGMPVHLLTGCTKAHQTKATTQESGFKPVTCLIPGQLMMLRQWPDLLNGPTIRVFHTVGHHVVRGTRDLLIIEDEGHDVIHIMHTLNLSQVALQQRRFAFTLAPYHSAQR